MRQNSFSKVHPLLAYLLGLVVSFAITRLLLFVSPHFNLNLGSYNIHHLYLGAVLLIFIAIFQIAGVSNNYLAVIAGVSSALILDQLVFLIATDGGDLTYLGAVSFWGGVISTVIIAGIAIGIYFLNAKKKR